MSTNFNEDDIAALVQLLSVERLTKLVKLTGSNDRAIVLHQDILSLNSSLMVIIAVIEIAIRNSVSEQLNSHFNTTHWLEQPPPPFQWRQSEKGNISKALEQAKRNEYTKMAQSEKHKLDALAYPKGRPANISHKNRSKNRQAQIPVSDGKVIAELTLFFWKRMFSEDYEHALWKPSLKRIFPNIALRRADVAKQLEVIYQTRNRLAHHEPVYERRLDEALTAIDFVIQNLGSKQPNEHTPLAKLLAYEMTHIRMQAQALNQKIAHYRNRLQ
jgi:hypothetical protein